MTQSSASLVHQILSQRAQQHFYGRLICIAWFAVSKRINLRWSIANDAFFFDSRATDWVW